MDRLLRNLKPSPAALALAPVLAFALAPGCGDAAPPQASGSARPEVQSHVQPNVLIVSIDTLRADHLGCYGYAPYAEPVSPAIDQFAREGFVFERCFAPRGQTGPSLTSMLTGLYPSRHGVLDNFQTVRPEVTTVAREFAKAGYATHAFVSSLPINKDSKVSKDSKTGDPESGLGFSGSWFEAKPAMKQETQSRWDDAVERAFGEFLVRRRSDKVGNPRNSPPFFAWIHFYDVHQPYVAPAPYGTKFTGGYRGPFAPPGAMSDAAFNAVVLKQLDAKMLARAPLDPADAKYVTALYDGGIAAADSRFGRLLALLADVGIADDTIVVLTADHGEELGEHNGYWFHGNSVYDSVLRIPLIVRGPGVVATRKGDLVQNVDLLPSLLELAGLPVPGSLDGISFAPFLRGLASAENGGRQVAWSEWQHLVLGGRSNRWKFILNPRGARPKKPPYDLDGDPGYFIDCRELYDLAEDPRETRNLWRDRRDGSGRDGDGEIAALRRLVGEAYSLRFEGLLPGESESIDDPGERELLQAIGYVAGGARDHALDPQSCDDE